MMRYGLTLLFLLFFANAFAQSEAGKKLVQVSGIITDVDSNAVVPYVTITNHTNNGQRYAANYQGYFSIIAHPGDTLEFSAIGFANKKLVLPLQVKDHKYTALVKLKSEIIYLPTVKVRPWATVDEFTKEFLAMKIADDDYAIAKKNLSKTAIRSLSLTMPRDAQENYNLNGRTNFDRMMNVNMRQTNPLLNPFAWGRLMQDIFDGDKAREDGK